MDLKKKKRLKRKPLFYHFLSLLLTIVSVIIVNNYIINKESNELLLSFPTISSAVEIPKIFTEELSLDRIWFDKNCPLQFQDKVSIIISLEFVRAYDNSNHLKFKWNNIKFLDVNWFSSLEEFTLFNNKTVSLKLNNLNNLRFSDCISSKLTNLTINNCPRLERLIFFDSPLTNVQIVNCPNLIEISFSGNSLSSFNFLDGLNKEKLISLSVDNNRFSTDLTPFSKFVNLETLNLEKNDFFGSLEPLKNMTKLKWLYINNTNLDSGLEYLPNSLEQFIFSNPTDFPEKKVAVIVAELTKIGKPKNFNHVFSLRDWKQINQEIIDLIKILANLRLALYKGVINDELIDKTLQIFIFEIQEKIITWRNKRRKEFPF